MGTRGQATTEFVLVMILVITFVSVVMSKVPITFSQAAPYLGSKVEDRLQTGRGFSQLPTWRNVGLKPKGGAR